MFGTNDTCEIGILQVSCWRFKQSFANGNKIFAKEARQDSPWSRRRDSEEPYALVMVLADREQANAQRYAQVRAVLEACVQTRACAQV